MPEGWAWASLSEIANLYTGNSINENDKANKYSNLKEGLFYIATKDIDFEGKVNYNNGIRIPLSESKFKIAPAESTLLCIEGGSAGRKIGFIDQDVCFVNKLCCFHSDHLSNLYLFYYLQSRTFIDLFNSNKSGLIGGVSLNLLKSIFIPVAPAIEQDLISKTIAIYLEKITSLNKDKETLELTIKKAKSKILDLAIHGKLVPQDANDEPASVLLERLRSEKEEKIAKGELKRDKNDSYIYKGSDNCYYQRFADGHEEDISEEIPCELPESWAWCRIKDICTINPKNKLDDNLEVSFIPMTLIDAGYTNHHGQETRVWKKIKTGFTHFAENDVAIAKISPCFENKKSVILKNLKNGYGAGTTELYILRACSIVLPEYLFWIVKTDSFITEGVGNFSGVVGQQRLARDIVENYYIPLPPINEQKRIISKIVSVFEKLDIIENNIE